MIVNDSLTNLICLLISAWRSEGERHSSLAALGEVVAMRSRRSGVRRVFLSEKRRRLSSMGLRVVALLSSGRVICSGFFIVGFGFVNQWHYGVEAEQYGHIGEAEHEELYVKREEPLEPPSAEIAEEQQPQCGLYADTQRTPFVGAESLIPDAPDGEREA